MNATDLRKAAILVSVLDTNQADALLEQMGPAALRVREAVMNLDHVSEAEQAQVIREFLGKEPARSEKKSNYSGASIGNDDVHWDLPNPETLPLPSATADSATQPPFAFLLETDPVPLSKQLQRETPQIIAVVLAHLPADYAAEVLQQLPTGLASDVLVRIAHLDEMSSDVLSEIENQLRAALSPYLRSKKSRQHGAAKVGAILNRLPNGSRGQLENAIQSRDEYLLRLHTDSRTTESDKSKQFAAEQPDRFPRLAAHTVLDHSEETELEAARRMAKLTSMLPHRSEIEQKVSARQPAKAHRAPAPNFHSLSALSDNGWQQLLEHADEQVVLLAFAGAEPTLINRLLKSFPKKEADYWRKQFAHPGPVRLTEIDDAQAQLAELAADLADAGLISWPGYGGFAAVA